MHENVLNFKIDLVAGTEGATRFIDIAKCMSMVNRKLYNQQGLWHVLGARTYAQNLVGGAVPVSGVAYSVAIRGAPRGWATRNSLVKMFEFWKEQQAKAYRAVSPSIKPKWQDFKVFLDSAHISGTELTPVSGDQFSGTQDPYALGEWIHSKIVATIEDAAAPGHIETIEPQITIMGDSTSTTVGCIKEYQISRARPFDPDPDVPGAVNTSIYAEASEALGEQVMEIVDNMEGDNDSPPYDVDDYPGGASNATDPQCFAIGANATGATLGRFMNLNGFSAPNGLLEIQVNLGKGEPDVGEFWLQLIVGKREAY